MSRTNWRIIGELRDDYIFGNHKYAPLIDRDLPTAPKFFLAKGPGLADDQVDLQPACGSITLNYARFRID